MNGGADHIRQCVAIESGNETRHDRRMRRTGGRGNRHARLPPGWKGLFFLPSSFLAATSSSDGPPTRFLFTRQTQTNSVTGKRGLRDWAAQ